MYILQVKKHKFSDVLGNTIHISIFYMRLDIISYEPKAEADQSFIISKSLFIPKSQQLMK